MRAWLSFRSVVVALVACTAGVGCKDVANKTYCDGSAEFVCSDPAKPVCDVATKTCVAGVVDGDMGGDGSVDKDMPGVDGNPGDDMVPGPDLLPMCKESSECTVAGAPVCGSDGNCRACEGSGDDAVCVAKGAHVCITAGTNDGQCGECDPVQANVENTTCTGAKNSAGPICDATGHCVKCTAHAQCNSKVCDFETGVCADPSTIAYVNNFGTASSTDECVDTVHDSAPPNKPYCQVAAAISVSGKNLLSVAGSTIAYDRLSLSNLGREITIIGPGASASPTARIFGGSPNDSIEITNSGGATADATLNLDGVEVGGTDAARTRNGIRCDDGSGAHTVFVNVKASSIRFGTDQGIASNDCSINVTASTISSNSKRGIDASGAGAITVVDSVIHANGQIGIDVSDTLTLNLSRSTITSNGGGLQIAIVDYIVENTLIAKNVGTGVNFDGSTPADNSRFWFVTVVRNGTSGNEGGVRCGDLSGAFTRPIKHSIIALNTTTDTNPTQLGGDCAFESVVAGSTETSVAAGLDKTTPMLVDANPTGTTPDVYRMSFSLQVADTVAKNKLDPSDTFPVTDLFGTARPQGPKFDIGAHEAAP